MATIRERVVQWLRDAHAAEEQAHSMLSRTAQQVDGHPEFRQGLERHAEASRGQAQRLEDCLSQLGENTSALKTITGQVSAFVQSLSGYVVSDEPVKAVLATSTFAQMEVSSYRILVTAAGAAGLQQVEALCRALLAEETAFAEWLGRQSETVTRDYLVEQKADA
jgi:ferritin-like metal-binding protein YciE